MQERSRQLEALVADRTIDLKEANSLLEREIAERKRAEKALAKKAAEEAVEFERNRLARELHDAVTQTLFSASLIAEVLPYLWQKDEAEGRRRVAELGSLARGALAEMRMLLLELRPAGFAEATMAELLEQLAESMGSRVRLPIEVGVVGNFQLPTEVKLVFYRIAQEALNNIIKHACANSVRLAIEFERDELVLLVEDDGCGFHPDDVSPERLGLGIMQERAAEIGAEFKINSRQGIGTQIIVKWRVPKSQLEE